MGRKQETRDEMARWGIRGEIGRRILIKQTGKRNGITKRAETRKNEKAPKQLCTTSFDEQRNSI